MALSERFFRQKPRAWELFSPLLEARPAPPGFDPAVGEAVYAHYREAGREPDAEKASAAIAHYLYSACAAESLARPAQGENLHVRYHLTGFFMHTAAALGASAEWLAEVFEMLLPRNARPSLFSDDFLARFALIDLRGHGVLKEQRSWMEEAFAYRWHASSRNSILWSKEGEDAVVNSIGVRTADAPALGKEKLRTTTAAPVADLCRDYLARLSTVLRAMFESGAERLARPKQD